MQKFALISVFDKKGVVEFARELTELGYTIISTGGTAKTLQEATVSVTPIQEITGNPESFDGRIKTISFEVESGILFDRSKPEHVSQAEKLNIKPIDIVVCNLYPFEETVKKDVSLEEATEQIDIGGPLMVRAAAKNHKNVLVVVDPKDYDTILGDLKLDAVSTEKRKQLAAKAFRHTAFYDAQIGNYLDEEVFPEEIAIPGRKVLNFRYGDNPHQAAALFEIPYLPGVLPKVELKAGRELSLTNFTDINAGYEVVRLFSEPCAVVIKHNNPCGAALGETISEALDRAIDADPESAFGGVVVLNKPMDLNTAQIIADFKREKGSQMDIIAIPEIENDALDLIKQTRKTTGVYTFGKVSKLSEQDTYIKSVDGGFILQTPDTHIEKSFKDWKMVTKVKPTTEQQKQMEIGWKLISRIKSNAVIIMDPRLPMTRGIGTGQTSRVRSTTIALEQAGSHTKGGILVSDSFFPFSDSVEAAVKHGISAVLQQGGSVRDQDSIDAANRAGIAMVMTGRRAFWH